MRQVLLLNASEEILQLINWQRAINLIFNGKAEPPYNYDYKYKIPHSSGVFYLPKAIRLKKYIHIPRKKQCFLVKIYTGETNISVNIVLSYYPKIKEL